MKKIRARKAHRIPGALRGACAALMIVAVPVAASLPAAAQVQVLDVSSLAERLLPAVVNISSLRIEARSQSRDGFRFGPRRGRQGRSVGSGFIIDSAGFIVTNNHVIANAKEVMVTMQDGTDFMATVLGTDPLVDLALLKIDAGRPLPFVQWGNSNAAKVGQPVIAIGTPFGLGGTVTTGIVSAVERDIRSGPFDSFIQTDAAINSGNSGGPLFDVNGRVIGINTAIFSRGGGNVGIGFAIPQSIAQEVVAELRQTGSVRRGQLGVQISPVTQEIAAAAGIGEARGVLIGSVVEGSPAAAAGLRKGDIIISFNGTPVDGTDELVRSVIETQIGTTVEIGLLRVRQAMRIAVTIAERI
ncbi:MAG: trypsin-like peptidase domain-containing protein [Alphaproteobacteria bacterium]|nr:trypsin-like peptidase domain-containing protein [Alphaproteobacteria bacterium]